MVGETGFEPVRGSYPPASKAGPLPDYGPTPRYSIKKPRSVMNGVPLSNLKTFYYEKFRT